MNDRPDREMNDFIGDFGDEMGYTVNQNSMRRRQAFPAQKSQKQMIIFGVLGVFLLIILLILLLRGGGKTTNDERMALSSNMDQLAKRVLHLEELENRWRKYISEQSGN